MVYCTRCGTKNEDNAEVCANCGVALYAAPFQPSWMHEHRRAEIHRGNPMWGLGIGIIILLAGIIWLLQQAGIISPEISVWPFVLVIFGISDSHQCLQT